MSNLSTSVKFDVLRGWPNGGAVAESYPVASTKTVLEGQFVVVGGTANAPSVDVGAAALVTSKSIRLVIQGNDKATASDGFFTGKAVTLRGSVTIQTEKFVPTTVSGVTTYVPGNALTIVGGAGIYAGFLCSNSDCTAGTGLTANLSTGTVVGYVESYDATNGILVAALV